MSERIPDDLLPAMRAALLGWFAENMRPLPWRLDRTPYGVWISEVMLQQTQMERGVERWRAWMRRFPDVASLAAAREDDVLAAWEGLGYYSRARNVLKAARTVVSELGGAFPSDPDAIRRLPGVGPYTAAAVASIAFGADVPCVDANAERVVSRLWDMAEDVRREPGRSALAARAAAFLTKGRAGEHNQAVMELGALVCARRPRCGACPLRDFCLARRAGTELDRPVLPAREGRVPLSTAAGLLCDGRRLLVRRVPAGEIWAGLWTFPGGAVGEGESPAAALEARVLEQAGLRCRAGRRLCVLRHGYTRHDVTLRVYALEFEEGGGFPARRSPSGDLLAAAPAELSRLAMPSAHRKIAESLSLREGRLVCSLEASPPLLPGVGGPER